MARVSEGLFTTDKYNKPMVLKDKDAVAILLLRLLVMVPGTNRKHPEMGIDIRGRYEYCEEDEVDELNTEIQTQIKTYLPQFNTSSVNCITEGRDMKIAIKVDDTVFNFSTASNLSDNEISLMMD